MKEEKVKNVALSVVLNTGLEKEGREKASDFLVTLSKSDEHRLEFFFEIFEFFFCFFALFVCPNLISLPQYHPIHPQKKIRDYGIL